MPVREAVLDLELFIERCVGSVTAFEQSFDSGDDTGVPFADISEGERADR